MSMKFSDIPEQDRRVHVLTDSELPELCRSLFVLGQDVPLVVTGNSMEPFLKDKTDLVFLHPAGKLRKGDVALFRRPNGRMVLHRVLRIRNGNLWMCGDNQVTPEGPVPREAVLAVAVRMVRGSRHWDTHSARWLFFRSIWRWFRPLRPAVAKCRRIMKGGSL